jgi:hypothetical protein
LPVDSDSVIMMMAVPVTVTESVTAPRGTVERNGIDFN